MKSKFFGNELKYVQEVLASDMKSGTSGSWNQRLESSFTQRFGMKYAISHNSGTSALHSCLASIGVSPGDEVISPALTVMMDTFSILYQGATPVYADIDPDTFNVDPHSIEEKITSHTKAIIAVHLYGLPCDMNHIMEIASEHNIPVIEDSAQCYLSTCKGRTAGSIGDLSIFSFENSKHISVGEGGIALTNDEVLATKVRKFAGIGFKNLTADGGRIRLNEDIFQDPEYKRHDTLGFNYRLPELNAAVAVAQMENLEEIVNKRIAIAKHFEDAIEGSCLIPQEVPSGYTNSYWTYALKYDGDWRDFRKAYKKAGGDGFYAAWSVPYLEPVMKNYHWFARCPTAELIQPKIMQFKTNYRDLYMAEAQANILNEVLHNNE